LPARNELPDRAHHRGIDLAREIEHAFKPRERFLALVIVIAERDAELVGDGAFLDATDEKIDILFQNEFRQLQRIRIIYDNRSFVAYFRELLVILRPAGL